ATESHQNRQFRRGGAAQGASLAPAGRTGRHDLCDRGAGRRSAHCCQSRIRRKDEARREDHARGPRYSARPRQVTSAPAEPRWLDSALALAVHDRQLAEHGGGGGIRDEGMLESALSRPLNLWGYGKPDLAALAAAYAFG